MLTSLLGAGLSLTCLIWLGLKSIYIIVLYLTNWVLVLDLLTFTLLLLNKFPSHHKKLLIITWTLGCQVSLVFWVSVYPLLPESKIPPAWFNFLSHGGIHLLLCKLFIEKKPLIKTRDLQYPCIVLLLYTLLILLPSKSSGLTIYPSFLEDFQTTLSILFFSTSVILSSFFLGKYLSSKTKQT
jgi:hypothetical protein